MPFQLLEFSHLSSNNCQLGSKKTPHLNGCISVLVLDDEEITNFAERKAESFGALYKFETIDSRFRQTSA
jgi:hypothetical protein